MKRLVKPLFMTAVILSAVACSEKKQLTEMHDATLDMDATTKELLGSTKEMKATTQQVVDSTGEMKKATEEMRKATMEVRDKTVEMAKKTDRIEQGTQQLIRATGELCDISRQGASLQFRREAHDALLKNTNGAKKLEEATAYFMSFEYQVWAACGADNEDVRIELMNDAVSEFMKSVREFVTDENSLPSAVAKVDGTSRDYLQSAVNRDASFNALAATLHRINRKQEEILKEKSDVKMVSMYSMIADTLRMEKDLNEGRIDSSSLKIYQREILNNRDLAIRLLQARHNHIRALFLAKAKPVEGKMNKLRQGVNYYLGGTLGTTVEWVVDLDSYNVAQLQELKLFLDGAAKTKALLVELGIKPVLDETVAAMFKKMKLKTAGKGDGVITAARVELMATVEEAKK